VRRILFHTKHIFVHYVVILITSVILLYGSYVTLGIGNDLYECYATVFLHGADEMPPQSVCLETVSYVDGHHNRLPVEYPILALIPMLIPTIAGGALYAEAMTGFLLIFVFIIYFLLYYKRSKASAFTFLLYLVIGGFGITLERLDIIIGAFILICLWLAEQKRFFRAYLLLAMTTMMKFVPLFLLLPLFLSEQKGTHKNDLKKFHGLTVFMTIVLLTFGISFLIDSRGTTLPFQYNAQRPIELESVPATIMNGLKEAHGVNICYGAGYGSYNIYGNYHGKCNNKDYTAYQSFDQIIITTGTFFFLLGLLLLAKQFINNKLTLPQFFLGTLLLFVTTTKVLSPQYFLWIFPLIAYVYGYDKVWTPLTVILAFLTSLIFPYLFGGTIFALPNPAWLTNTITVRNLLLIGITVCYVFNCFNLRNRNHLRVK